MVQNKINEIDITQLGGLIETPKDKLDVDGNRVNSVENVVKTLTKGERASAVSAKLIPEDYVDYEFNGEEARSKIKEASNKRNRTDIYLDDYIDVTTKIHIACATGEKVTNSYLIGAPSGSFQQEFVTSCIKNAYAHNMKCVPYISLYELASLKKKNDLYLSKDCLVMKAPNNNYYIDEDNYGDNFILENNIEMIKQYKLEKGNDEKFVKVPLSITGYYSWEEYVNADIVFCAFTGVESRDIETKTLKLLLTHRGINAKPTVVMLFSSIKPYVNDVKLRSGLWEDMLAPLEVQPRKYDKLIYKHYFSKDRVAV